MSLAGLTPSSDVSLSLKALQSLLDPHEAPRRAAAQNPVNLSPALINAITREAGARMESFVRGIKTYQAHPYRRTLSAPPPVWRCGAATLHSYGGPEDGVPVLAVPSLVNRAYILDLAEDRSFMRAAAAAGFRPFLLDWGDPTAAERAFTVEDYIEGVLVPALEEIKSRTGQIPRLVGYCLGGVLSAAPAVLRPDLVSALVLLAVPWDFQEGTEASRALINFSRTPIEIAMQAEGVISVDLLQAMFASLDPTLVGRKFRKFAALDPRSDHARHFVELEDWLNDGVPLAAPVAQEILFKWYGTNDPIQGRWKVGEAVVDPRRISCPTLALIPLRDRIVPPESARRLARLIPGAAAREMEYGHISMVAAGSAPKNVYEPVLAWLKDPPKP